jgi:hypothetical protein
LCRVGQQTQRPVQAGLAAAIRASDYIQSTQRDDEITQGTVVGDSEGCEHERKNAIIELKIRQKPSAKPKPIRQGRDSNHCP